MKRTDPELARLSKLGNRLCCFGRLELSADPYPDDAVLRSDRCVLCTKLDPLASESYGMKKSDDVRLVRGVPGTVSIVIIGDFAEEDAEDT